MSDPSQTDGSSLLLETSQEGASTTPLGVRSIVLLVSQSGSLS